MLQVCLCVRACVCVRMCECVCVGIKEPAAVVERKLFWLKINHVFCLFFKEQELKQRQLTRH